MVTQTWMARLAAHYQKIRETHPNDRLLVLFDIDGTILDMRYLVHYVLQRYDQQHNTAYFENLQPADITVHENQIDYLLHARNIDSAWYEQIKRWFEREAWSSPAMMEAHRPFAGVLEVIRWFQLQPNTEVGLNTGRLETIRADTLRSLNQLGQEYKVRFVDPLLYMNKNSWGDPVTLAKTSGIRYFQEMGYRIVAFIDNEPANLQAVAQLDPHEEILLLHADTIFQSRREHLPPNAIGGVEYDLTELVSEQSLPHHIHLVWNNINMGSNLLQFLASNVYWGQLTLFPGGVVSAQNEINAAAIRDWVDLELLLHRLASHNKGIKINLSQGGHFLLQVTELLAGHNLSGLWFDANVGLLHEREFRYLATSHPVAIIQTSIDFLAPMISRRDPEAKQILEMYRQWGINRFGLSRYLPQLHAVTDQMDVWGFEVDIYDVRTLEAFLQAVLLMPRSITSTFNFPKWSYFGADSEAEKQRVVEMSSL